MLATLDPIPACMYTAFFWKLVLPYYIFILIVTFFFFFFNKFSRHLIRRKSVLSYLNILAVFVFKAVDKTLLFLLNYFVGLNIWNTHSILTAFHIGDSKVFLFLFLFWVKHLFIRLWVNCIHFLCYSHIARQYIFVMLSVWIGLQGIILEMWWGKLRLW